MLEVLTKFTCALIMTLFGIFVIQKVTNCKIKILSLKTIIGIVVLCLATITISKNEYAGIGTVDNWIEKGIIKKRKHGKSNAYYMNPYVCNKGKRVGKELEEMVKDTKWSNE